jgi:hypothetical protein
MTDVSIQAMNQEEFVGATLAANLSRALGRQSDGSLKGGLTSATVIKLPIGTRLCRIANSSLPARMNLSSMWWVREVDFVSFLRASRAEDRDLLDTIRNSLALSTDFAISNERADEIRAKYGDDALGDLKNSGGIRPWDRVFTVEVIGDLLAFSGIGRDVADTSTDSPLGTLRTWKAASAISQLIIPGLLDPAHRGLSAMGKVALHFRRSQSLSHWRDWTLPDLD